MNNKRVCKTGQETTNRLFVPNRRSSIVNPRAFSARARGQAFTSMKILIGAVVALALLAIVYQVTQNVSPPVTSIETIKDLVKQATQAPGECFNRLNVPFQAGEVLNPETLKPTRVTFYGSRLPIISCAGICSVNQKIVASASAKCSPTTSVCEVWFLSKDCKVI